MSNYHVLSMTNKQHEINVVFHISVPNENNSVSVNLRTALIQYITYRTGAAPTTKMPWDISTEATEISNGEVYEYMEVVKVNGNMSLAEKRTVIDGRYSQLAVLLVSMIQNKLAYWGLDRNV